MAAVFPEGRTEEAVEKYIRTPRFKQARAEAFSDALMTLVSGAVAPILKPLAAGKTMISGARHGAAPKTVVQYIHEILRTPQRVWGTVKDVRVVPQQTLKGAGAQFYGGPRLMELGPRTYPWSTSREIVQHELGHAAASMPGRFAPPSATRGLGDLEKLISMELQRLFREFPAGAETAAGLAYKASPPEMLARSMEKLVDIPGSISPEVYKRMFGEALASSLARGRVIKGGLTKAPFPPTIGEVGEIQGLIDALSGFR